MPADFLNDLTKLAVDPFRIIGGVHYVGNTNVSAHLVQTTDGLILIDTAFGRTVELLCDSITGLGFDLADINRTLGFVPARRRSCLETAVIALREALQAAPNGSREDREIE